MNMTAMQPRISQRNVITWLCESPVFESLSETDIQPLLSSIRILNFKPMDRAIGEGKFSAALYIVIDGHFKVL